MGSHIISTHNLNRAQSPYTCSAAINTDVQGPIHIRLSLEYIMYVNVLYCIVSIFLVFSPKLIICILHE